MQNPNIDYILLRSLIVSYLTLFNGRRGQDVVQITNKEYEDALNGVWMKKVRNNYHYDTVIK